MVAEPFADPLSKDFFERAEGPVLVTDQAGVLVQANAKALAASHPLAGLIGTKIDDVTTALPGHRVDHQMSFALGEPVYTIYHLRSTRTTTHVDQLTGLLNRVGVNAEMSTRLSTPGDPGFCLFFLTVKGLSEVNDRLGHSAGDAVIQLVADAVRAALPTALFQGRTENSVFVAAMPRGGTTKEYFGQAEVLRQRIASLTLGDTPVGLSINLGMADVPTVAADVADLRSLIDYCLSLMKTERNRGDVRRFTRKDFAAMTERKALEDDVKRAVKENQFVLFYQLQVDTMSAAIVGAEALVRWRHPTKGILPPSVFIPVLEALGLMREVELYIVSKSIHDLGMLIRQHLLPEGFKLSVNCTPEVFALGNFPNSLFRALDRQHVPHDVFKVEIVESASMEDTGTVHDNFKALRKAGIDIALDDFGTGYSSFSHVTTFDFTQFKLDKSFIDTILTDKKQRQVVTGIINLAHGLGVDIIAEGVETAAQSALLRKLGCNKVQGYLFAKPVSFNEFKDRLAEFKQSPRVAPIQ